jgi:hypothetical protein
LDGDDGSDENIVESFSFYTDIQLLDTVRHSTNEVFDAANNEAETRWSETGEFSETFDDANFSGRDGKWNLEEAVSSRETERSIVEFTDRWL